MSLSGILYKGSTLAPVTLTLNVKGAVKRDNVYLLQASDSDQNPLWSIRVLSWGIQVFASPFRRCRDVHFADSPGDAFRVAVSYSPTSRALCVVLEDQAKRADIVCDFAERTSTDAWDLQLGTDRPSQFFQEVPDSWVISGSFGHHRESTIQLQGATQ